MGTISARYDRSATRYERWWAPVLAPGSTMLLDAVDRRLGGRSPVRVLDIGAGTGTLTRSAAIRWPGASVVALDGSRAMLQVGRGEADRTLAADVVDRLDWVVGLAQDMPFADGAFDLALSSFVMQLVPDRRAALHEALRVISPGGWLAYVTWLDDGEAFEPEEVFEQIVDEERLEDALEMEEPRSGDVASPAAAARQLRRIGFRDVSAARATLEHRWTARSYLAFLERYDAADLFSSLEPDTRRHLRERTAARLVSLPPPAFVWRAPIVVASGRRPAGTA
jgi:ubiquinone/menaquinone biosynthesis C-methylase UbiE